MIAAALKRLGACGAACEWAADRADPTQAWQDCPDGSWLAWIVVRTARTDAERREALGVVCAVVREIAPPRDPASERALSLAEAWCRGKRVSRRDLSAVARAAAAAYAAYASYASYAASYAASSYAAAVSAAAASYARAASYAASSYAAASSAASARAVSADAIRRRLPEPPAWVVAACEVPS